MSTLNAALPALNITPRKPQCKAETQYRGKIGLVECRLSVPGMQLVKCGLSLPGMQSQPFHCGRSIPLACRASSSTLICAAALNARCGAEQTQTVTRESSTITIAPVIGKEKLPELDDGGTGFPPRDDGDGGGGGGGGGHGWSGGFFFFGLLAFLGFLKDQESEGPYRNERRRYRTSHS